jgi:hypothetical protein
MAWASFSASGTLHGFYWARAMLAKRSAQRDRTLFRDRAQPSETMASGIQDRRIKPLQLKIRQAARTVSVLKMVGRGWQTDRAGAVAIRLPYGLELSTYDVC